MIYVVKAELSNKSRCNCLELTLHGLFFLIFILAVNIDSVMMYNTLALHWKTVILFFFFALK